jgi:Transposase DDE domain/Transposase domain (DUF772)
MNTENQEKEATAKSFSAIQKLSNFFKRIMTVQHVMPFLCDDNSQEIILTNPLQKLIHTIEALQLSRAIPADSQFLGRKRSDRLTLAQCFVAKCILNIPTTKALIERITVDASLRRIVGYERINDVPNESTFSRAFQEFTKMELFQNIHATFIVEHLGDFLLDNLSRDATAIEAREKPDKERMKELKTAQEEKKKLAAEKKQTGGKKRGRPSKQVQQAETTTEAAPSAHKPPNVIEKQRSQSLPEILSNLATVCDIGTKCNAQGFKNSWKGYKLHLDTNAFGVPISAILTSASVHDSQVAIPLTLMSKSRVTNLYDLMDAGYCSESLREFSREQGHVPLIDHNARRGEKREFLDFEAERYKGRSSSERSNGRLKDEFGGRSIRVKGHAKIACHLMIGVVCLAVDALMRFAP